MTLKIELYVPQEKIESHSGSEYLALAMAAIGFSRGVTLAMPTQAAEPIGFNIKSDPEVGPPTTPYPLEQPVTDETPKRERGKPSNGRARRTKEEIAEDEAADAADAAAVSETATDKPNISTGEERHDPATSEETAKDAADEKADKANASDPTNLTRDDVRAAMTAYSADFGMDGLMADLKPVLADSFPGQNVTKLSEIPEGFEHFKKVIDGLAAKRAARG